MSATLPVLAGVTSTIMFAFSMVPMLVKAGRTKDLSSYSLGNIVLVNVGNVVHSVYVFHLPAGPIWALHVFCLVSSGAVDLVPALPAAYACRPVDCRQVKRRPR